MRFGKVGISSFSALAPPIASSPGKGSTWTMVMIMRGRCHVRRIPDGGLVGKEEVHLRTRWEMEGRWSISIVIARGRGSGAWTPKGVIAGSHILFSQATTTTAATRRAELIT